MGWVLLGLGLVLVIEGLVFALAPSRIDEALEFLRQIPHETRRVLGRYLIPCSRSDHARLTDRERALCCEGGGLSRCICETPREPAGVVPAIERR